MEGCISVRENRDDWLEKVKVLEEAIKELPKELQNAICWAVENYPTLENMGRASNMTSEEIQCAMENALAEKNYVTLILLHITKTMIELKENEES